MDTPVLFKEYTTSSVIVMEYINGYAIDDKEHLLEDGYDMNEIGSKYVDNFIKQVMDDGFFMRIRTREMYESGMVRLSGSTWV